MIDVAKIREGMPVISSDDFVIGTVSRATGEVLVTSHRNGCGFDHPIPMDWIEEIGSEVFLNKGRQFLEMHCDEAARGGGAHRKAA